MKPPDNFITPKQGPIWRDLYRVLFDRNIAGILLSNAEGRIIDCNEPCARIFGFHSKMEMLSHSAWEFYFHRAEREALLDRLRTRGTCQPLGDLY